VGGSNNDPHGICVCADSETLLHLFAKGIPMQVIRAWMQRTETIHWHEFDSNDAITRSYAMP